VDYTTKKQAIEKVDKKEENLKEKTENIKKEKEPLKLNQFKYITVEITDTKLKEILGNPKFKYKEVLLLQPGMCIGLAWTSVGGTILEIETSLSRGTGQLKLTGQLGEVMKESAITALSWIKSNGHKWGIKENMLLDQLGVKTLNKNESITTTWV